MARFLLVHGSCHGAWCWSRVVDALTRLGHEARAIDLPAHGDDPTPASEVTLDLYASALLAAAEAPTVLVGHSAAGFPVTLAAALDPGRIARLIYLCAYVPKTGKSIIDLRRAGPRQPLKDVVRADPGGVTYSADPQGARRTFFHDCPEDEIARALPRLCPEPIAPQATALPPGTETPPQPRHYILCQDDHTIPPEYQAEMARPFGAAITRLPSGHSPFLTAPARLARVLAALADEGPSLGP
ncbi:alpha/beta fold hydrolase [Albidovulum sediminicola]|uniref:Alpha/beta fold hydrolase n=1 Tax=Albidovulum sediminicola TaxID=2984331 RepID=A0ABT2YXI6_9RHOB|nr:alpha/beta fold hydrolase [Defluviimonas sp. WL0075]MCV2863568.1 alpha/beta fold hydrolase [Defluviimonas sp. WL0075]